MEFEVFHPGLLGRTDVIAVDMIHYAGLWGPSFSHHPPNNNHPRYAADTSTEGVLRFLLERWETDGNVELGDLQEHTVTTHHFDSDALQPVWAFLNPVEALSQRDLLTRVARCGDFFIYLDDQSAKLNFIVEELHSRLRESGARGGRIVDNALSQACFDRLLPRWSDLLDDASPEESLWDQPMRLLERDLGYLSAPGRITELWDCHTTLVETEHDPDAYALNTLCRNDLLFIWRTDSRERRIDVRPAIGWYILPSMPHQPRYNLERLCIALNHAEGSETPAWKYLPGPKSIRSPESSLTQQQITGLLANWISSSPETEVPHPYRTDVQRVLRNLDRHVAFTSNRRFASAAELRFAPESPYEGLHLLGNPGAIEAGFVRSEGKSPLSFAVSDDFYWNRRILQPLELEISYRAAGDGRLWLEYDAWGGANLATGPVDLADDGGEATCVFKLDDARFGNNQEGGADFRIMRDPGTTISLTVVRLRKK